MAPRENEFDTPVLGQERDSVFGLWLFSQTVIEILALTYSVPNELRARPQGCPALSNPSVFVHADP